MGDVEKTPTKKQSDFAAMVSRLKQIALDPGDQRPEHAKLAEMARLLHQNADEHYTQESMGTFETREAQLQIVERCVLMLTTGALSGCLLSTGCGTGKTATAAATLRRLAVRHIRSSKNAPVYKALLIHPEMVSTTWRDAITGVFADYPNIRVLVYDVGKKLMSTDFDVTGRQDFLMDMRDQADSQHPRHEKGQPVQGMHGTVIVYVVTQSYTTHENAANVITLLRADPKLHYHVVIADEATNMLRKGNHDSRQARFLDLARAGLLLMVITATPLVRGRRDAVTIMSRLYCRDFYRYRTSEVYELFTSSAIRTLSLPRLPVNKRLHFYVVLVAMTDEQKELIKQRTHRAEIRAIQVSQVFPRPYVPKKKRKLEDAPQARALGQPPTRFIFTNVFYHIFNSLVSIRKLKMGPSMIVLERLAAIHGFKAALEKYDFKVGIIIGDMSSDERKETIRLLNSDDENERLDAILVQIDAGGTGIDLSRCERCYLGSPDWLHTQTEQAAHRPYRIGKPIEELEDRQVIMFVTEGPEARQQFEVAMGRLADTTGEATVPWPAHTVTPDTYMAITHGREYHLQAEDALTYTRYNHRGVEQELTPLTTDLRKTILGKAESAVPGSTTFYSEKEIHLMLGAKCSVSVVTD